MNEFASPGVVMTVESPPYPMRPRVGRWQVADRAPVWTGDRFDRALCVVVDARKTTPDTLRAFLDVLMAQHDTVGRTPHIAVATTREIAAATFYSPEGPDVDGWTESHGMGFLVFAHPFPHRVGQPEHKHNEPISVHFGGDALGRAIHWAHPGREAARNDVYGVELTNVAALRPDWLTVSPCAQWRQFPYDGVHGLTE